MVANPAGHRLRAYHKFPSQPKDVAGGLAPLPPSATAIMAQTKNSTCSETITNRFPFYLLMHAPAQRASNQSPMEHHFRRSP